MGPVRATAASRLLLLVLLSSGSSCWDLSNPYDPERCDPRCAVNWTCHNGKCAPATLDAWKDFSSGYDAPSDSCCDTPQGDHRGSDRSSGTETKPDSKTAKKDAGIPADLAPKKDAAVCDWGCPTATASQCTVTKCGQANTISCAPSEAGYYYCYCSSMPSVGVSSVWILNGSCQCCLSSVSLMTSCK
jgi:hypothetical protein